TGAHDAENIVVLVDAVRGLDADTGRIIDGLRDAKRRAVLALNKVDKVKRGDLLPLAQALDREGVFDRIFMISGLTSDGVEDLKVYLANALPRGPWLYPEDEITDVPLRLLAAEATREQIFRQLHQELPYSVTVETEKWEDRADGSVRIDQVVHVAREGQKAIVVGAEGRQIKSIGAAARADLEAIFQRRVHLFIQVRVTENWTEDRERYAAMRLDFDE
ncbi:MAG: GTPase Era, partial [Stellaceae bacterium]